MKAKKSAGVATPICRRERDHFLLASRDQSPRCRGYVVVLLVGDAKLPRSDGANGALYSKGYRVLEHKNTPGIRIPGYEKPSSVCALHPNHKTFIKIFRCILIVIVIAAVFSDSDRRDIVVL